VAIVFSSFLHQPVNGKVDEHSHNHLKSLTAFSFSENTRKIPVNHANQLKPSPQTLKTISVLNIEIQIFKKEQQRLVVLFINGDEFKDFYNPPTYPP
jgi:hypothetical protein